MIAAAWRKATTTTRGGRQQEQVLLRVRSHVVGTMRGGIATRGGVGAGPGGGKMQHGIATAGGNRHE